MISLDVCNINLYMKKYLYVQAPIHKFWNDL